MKRTILIVEDEVHLARILDFTLRSAGYETIVAHNGREGLEKAISLCPDLVILDLTLPEIDGETVCREIRRAAGSKGTRVIILTGRDVGRGGGESSVGADLWMEKPFRFEALLDGIGRLLAGGSTPAE